MKNPAGAKHLHCNQPGDTKVAGQKGHPWVGIVLIVAILAGLGLYQVIEQFGQARQPVADEPTPLGNPVAFGSTGDLVAAPPLTAEELRIVEALKAGMDPYDPNIDYLPTPLLAQYGGLLIHTPIAPRDLTEIEFHQASYNTALPLTPLVTIVDANEAARLRGTNHIPYEEQPRGNEPLIAEAVSTWRWYSYGAEMTAVDVGAATGTIVYAPITGIVVKVVPYKLYNYIDDYEIHIQSPDYPELDIVILHIEDLRVKVGDRVVGGATQIARVRDLGEFIDNNLSNFTKPPDPGNHCHVQVNDATRADYRGLEGALDIFNGRGYARPVPPAVEEKKD